MVVNTEVEEFALGEELALVISCELTVKVLVVLVERAASPKEIADILDMPTPRISHHVKKLKRLNLVELIDEKEVGGTIQHIYRAIVRPIVSNKDWAKLGIAERQRYSVWIVRMLLTDAAKSFITNLFDARAGRHLSRTPVVVDELGFDELAEIQNRALYDSVQVEAVAAERMAESGETGINVIAAMMCFELPEPSQGLKATEGLKNPEEAN